MASLTQSLLGGIAGGATVAITIKAIDNFSSTFNKAETGISGIGSVASIAVTSIAAVGVALTALSVSSLKIAADFEQTGIAFTTMLGSADKAEAFLKELADFAKNTPFTLTGVEKSARQLLAVGFNANEVIPTLKTVGDIASGLGMGEDGLQRLILNLGQVQAQGKLTGRELRDFAVAGIPLLDELGKSLNKSTEEIQAMVSSGEITTDMVVRAFEAMTGAGGRFEDLMSKQMDSVKGKFSNLQDSMELMQRELGKALIPIVSQFADILLNEVIPSLEPIIPMIGDLLATGFRTLFQIIEPLLPVLINLAQLWAEHSQRIMQSLSPALIKVSELFMKLLDEVILPLLEPLSNLIASVLDLAVEFAGPLVEGLSLAIDLMSMLTPVLTIVINTVNFLVNAIKLLVEWMNKLTFGIFDQISDKLSNVSDTVKKATKAYDVFDKSSSSKSTRTTSPSTIYLSKTKADSRADSIATGLPYNGMIYLNDFIMSNGKVYKPHKDDVIMGTKNGNGLGGLTVYIDNLNGFNSRDIAIELQSELKRMIRI